MAPIPQSNRRMVYNPVNSAGPFPIDFPLFAGDGSDLVVRLNDLLLEEFVFSATVNGGFYGEPNTWINGSIMLPAPVTGELVILGRRAPRRQAQYAEGRGIPARDHNTELNTLTAIAQELRRDLDLALKPVEGLPEAVAAAAASADAAEGAAESAVAAAATAVSAAASITTDLWALKPVGEVVAVFDHLTGASVPPTDKAYRYVKLTAGLTGSGQYNNGVLSGESVSGSAPTISATATIALAGSPMNGQAIRLINSERRFLRAGSAGTLEDSQNLAHDHSITDPGHWHTSTSGTSPAVLQSGLNQSPAFAITQTSSNTTGITVNSAGGTEARSRNIGATYYMRIK